MEGYFFTTESKAKAKIKAINDGEGIPNNGFLTQTYCEYYPCEGGFYIESDSITDKYCTGKQTINL